MPSLTLLGLVVFLSILAQGAAAAEVAVGLQHDEFGLLAPDANHLAAAESNLQRWLGHVRLTSSRPRNHRGKCLSKVMYFSSIDLH